MHPSLNFIIPVFVLMAIAWSALRWLLFSRLERKHPKKYEAMGRPSMLRTRWNEYGSDWALRKFLFDREHVALDDGYLSKLSSCMVAYQIVSKVAAAFLVLYALTPGLQ